MDAPPGDVVGSEEVHVMLAYSSDVSSDSRVPIGPVGVCDATAADVVARLVDGMALGVGCVAFALHVGAFLDMDDLRYFEVMNSADTVYADGSSVVILARIAGATSIERAPTTDIGWDVLRAARQRLGRPARVALIGGPPGLAADAGAVIEQEGLGVCVITADGFQESYAPVLEDVRAANVEIIFVGMGMPLEALWVDSHRANLGPALVMTCGGWFGFVVGDEQRAPQWVQRVGMEWIWRLAQSPGRLGKRYAIGAVRTIRLIPGQVRLRRFRRR